MPESFHRQLEIAESAGIMKKTDNNMIYSVPDIYLGGLKMSRVGLI